MNTDHCARARLLISDMLQLLRDTHHSLQAHHNPAAGLLDSLLPALETLNARLQRDCGAERIPPWDAPHLPALSHFMDTLSIDVSGRALRQGLLTLLRETAAWLQHEGLTTLAQDMRQLADRLPPAPRTPPLDELAPVNEEGS